MAPTTTPPPDATSPAPGPTPAPGDADPVAGENVAAPREPEEPRKFEAPDGVKDSGRFAAYDTTLGKYVGGVHDSKSAAAKSDAAKAAASVEVVEV